MKARTYQFMMTALLFLFAMDTYGQSNKDKEEEIIENTYHADIVKQETDCWCVYACLQAIKFSSQCSECEKYIQDFLLDDYRNGNNPYPESFMSNDDFRAAMYLFDSCQVPPAMEENLRDLEQKSAIWKLLLALKSIIPTFVTYFNSTITAHPY